jgi:ribosomal protein L11 methylase PrmA
MLPPARAPTETNADEGIPVRAPGSFRDPRGYVAESQGRIFRAITEIGASDFNLARDSGLLDLLVAAEQLLPYSTSTASPSAFPPHHGHAVVEVIEAERLPLVTYPFEWCFSALKSAALLQLDILIRSLGHGIMLTDASAYNVQFVGTRPVFIDHLSFRKYHPGEYWDGHDQFIRQFLNPLLLECHAGIPFGTWYRGSPEGLSSAQVLRALPARSLLRPSVLLHLALPTWASSRVKQSTAHNLAATKPLAQGALLQMLEGLRRAIDNLKPIRTGPGTWAGYTQDNSYSEQAQDSKRRFVSEAIAAAVPRLVLDIGCNTGAYSMLAATAGAGHVIGVDGDEKSVEAAFLNASRSQAQVLPLHLDLLNPTPSFGWPGSERAGFFDRVKPDFVLALALVHHLALRGNVPFSEVIDWILGLAPQGIVEFIPGDDPMIHQLLAGRDLKLFADYSEETLRAVIARRHRIVNEIELSDRGRILIHYASGACR